MSSNVPGLDRCITYDSMVPPVSERDYALLIIHIRLRGLPRMNHTHSLFLHRPHLSCIDQPDGALQVCVVLSSSITARTEIRSTLSFGESSESWGNTAGQIGATIAWNLISVNTVKGFLLRCLVDLDITLDPKLVAH